MVYFGILTVVQKLNRYIFKEAIGLYILAVFALVLLLTIDMLTVWANFLIREQASLITILKLMLYKLPSFLHTALPVSVVFAILLASGRMAKDSELKAAQSLTISPVQMFKPFILIGVLASILALANTAYFEAISQRAYEKLEASFFYTSPPPDSQSNSTYLNDDGSIFYASQIRADEKDKDLAELSGVVILKKDGTVISAASGTWDSNKEKRKWILNNPEIVTDSGEVSRQDELALDFDAAINAGKSLSSKESLTLAELAQRIKKSKARGSKTRQLSYNFYSRIADAFSAVIFSIIAAALGLQLHGRASGFAWTIVLMVLFWALWILSAGLFEKQILSAFVAAWLPIAVAAILGLILAKLRLRL